MRWAKYGLRAMTTRYQCSIPSTRLTSVEFENAIEERQSDIGPL